MTTPGVPTFAAHIKRHYDRLVARDAYRDRIHDTIHEVRRGNIRQLFPSELDFSISFDGSPIANFVDIVAHDMAEGIAPLPALACVSGKMKSDADLARAEKKNRIGDNYWRHSNLEVQMLKAADRYVTYGFLPMFIDVDTECNMPYIHLEDPRGSHYELDRYGRVRIYAHRWRKSVDEIASLFPEYEALIRKNPRTGKEEPGDAELEMLRWVDSAKVYLMLPERQAVILDSYEHKLDRPPVVIAERPGEGDSPRGQFDDVIWVQVARAIMSTLALEAASIAVQSPIAVPDDMDQLSYGPHAILQSSQAQSIHKVNLDLPPQIFAENQVLDAELRLGARYPEARSGTPGTSVITGKGVQALLGSFDSQIKGAQMIFRHALERVTAMCFELDEKWFPHQSKTISGTMSGTSYELDYTPATDIKERYACTVTYGFAAGLAPEQSSIMLLQLEGAGLIAKGTLQENLPFGIDQMQEARKIHVEQSRDALMQGVFALVQSSGQMAAQGQDPMPIIQLAVDMIRNIEDGDPIEDAVADAFKSMQQAKQEAAEAAAGQQDQEGPGDQDPSGGMGGGGMSPDGLPEGVAPGQAGLPAGGRPTIQSMIAGFRGSGATPVMQSEVRRMLPTGGR